MPSENSDLTILAFLFAERVVVDQLTDRHTLVGVFDVLELTSEQKVAPPWFVFVSTEGEIRFSPAGTADIELSISREGREQSVFSGQGSIKLPSAPENELVNLQTQFAVPIRSLGMSPGNYIVSILVNRKPIAARRLIVTGIADDESSN